VGVDKEDLLSPSSQPSPLKGEGGSGLLTLSQKESSPKSEGFPPSPKGILKTSLKFLHDISISIMMEKYKFLSPLTPL
jgi:hypothetical protein